MKQITYAGIGARKTPVDVIDLMFHAAEQLEAEGCKLRSGGAAGADTAFFRGTSQNAQSCEIYIPWEGFQGFTGKDDGVYLLSPTNAHYTAAMDMAMRHHPNWTNLDSTARKFMIRNSYQIMGPDMQSPCDFVICWTPGGKGGGGTGQAIRIANTLEIPVFDLGAMDPDKAGDAISQILNQKG